MDADTVYISGLHSAEFNLLYSSIGEALWTHERYGTNKSVKSIILADNISVSAKYIEGLPAT